ERLLVGDERAGETSDERADAEGQQLRACDVDAGRRGRGFVRSDGEHRGAEATGAKPGHTECHEDQEHQTRQAEGQSGEPCPGAYAEVDPEQAGWLDECRLEASRELRV